jgi:zinc-ribbon domain
LNQPARTAGILIIVGLLLQGVQVVWWFVAGAIGYGGWLPRWIFFALGVVGAVWLVLVYLLAYRPVHFGEYQKARTPTLAFAVLSILTLEILSGLLFILAYDNLGKARSLGLRTSAQVDPRPLATGSKVCPACHRENPLSATFCQACGFILG